MPNLLPAGYDENIIEDDDIMDDQPIGYKNGVSFDYETGDYRRDGKNRILDSDGIESWRSWVINCINTERYKHLAYGTDFGVELDLVFAAESREEAESVLVRQCTEAILADPYGRTDYIDNIEIEWPLPDSVVFSCTLHGIQDVTIDITAFLTKSLFPDDNDDIPELPSIDPQTSSIVGIGVVGKMIVGSSGA